MNLDQIYLPKALKVKVPAFLDHLDDFVNIEYLKTSFSRYKKILEQTVIKSGGNEQKKKNGKGIAK